MSILKGIELTAEEKRFCEHHLRVWTPLEKKLTITKMEETFTAPVLKKMIMYEVASRQRKGVLDRLCGRYHKLKRVEDMKNIVKFIDAYKTKRTTRFELED